MTSQWSSKQKQSNIRAATALNKLCDRRRNYDLILESDKEITYHVRNEAFLYHLKPKSINEFLFFFLITIRKSLFKFKTQNYYMFGFPYYAYR